LVLQGATHVVHVHSYCRQPFEHGCGLVDLDVDGAGEGAVVLEGGDGDLREGVDGVGADQAVDVERVGIGGVLGGRRCPQRPLRVAASGGKALPPRPGETVAEHLVGKLGLREGSASSKREGLGGADGIQAPVDLGVDPADEE
jgi:hypothetical protein